MSASSDLEFGAVPSLGELLASLHRGDAAFEHLAATYRIWRHQERAQAAREAQAEEGPRRGTRSARLGASGSGNRPIEVEEVLRVWRAEGRVREEHDGGPRDGAYLVRDGDAWWVSDPGNGAHSNEGDLTTGYSDGEQIALMLDPTPLLGALRFTPTGRGHLAGRDTITADAVARPFRLQRPPVFELHQIGVGAERYELQVDAKRGVLLEAVAFCASEPFQRITTEQVTFDTPIDRERFRFTAPAGAEIRSPRNPRRGHHVPLAEAQQLAPFNVLVLERLPANWSASYTFFEPSQQPPTAAWMAINYRSDDGHEDVSLSQYAIGDQPGQYDLMLENDDWQTITHNGVQVQVRGGGQTQAHIQRDQTFVFLVSESLTVEQLGTLAAGLKPAPTTSSH
jgi:hypothetical protein